MAKVNSASSSVMDRRFKLAMAYFAGKLTQEELLARGRMAVEDETRRLHRINRDKSARRQ